MTFRFEPFMKIKTRIAVALFGLLIGLASLWCGAYFAHEYPYEHWANMPIFMTGTLFFIGGVCLVVFAVIT